MRSLLAILMLLLLSAGGKELRAQDLTGQWTGIATDNLSGKKQKLILTITQNDSSFGGVLHWYFPESQYIHHLCVGVRYLYPTIRNLLVSEGIGLHASGRENSERFSRNGVDGGDFQFEEMIKAFLRNG